MNTMRGIFYWFGLFLLCAGCAGKTEKQDMSVIRLEDKISNTESIKASDFVSEIRYVPLETSEECVVGNSPYIRYYKDLAIVGSDQRSCMVFDKNTGKYIRSVGFVDKGPQGYSTSSSFWINEQNGDIYFPAWGSNYVRYSINGEFLSSGNIPRGIGTVCCLDNDVMLGYSNQGFQTSQDVLVCFDRQDSVLHRFQSSSGTPPVSVTPSDIAAISILKGTAAVEKFGEVARGGVLSITLKDSEKNMTTYMKQPVFWRLGDDVYFKESLNDTVYRVTGEEMYPARVFDLGKYHLAQEESMQKGKREGRTAIDLVFENDRFIYFEFILDGIYRGMADKRGHSVKVAKVKDGIVNDIDGFMSLSIQGKTPEEFVTCIQPLDIHTWFEEHEGAEVPDAVARLKGLKEDDNPVLVIMKSK